MKRIAKWFGSSALMAASLFMMISVLSCGGKNDTKKFKVAFAADPADAGTVTAKTVTKDAKDSKAIKSGDMVAEGTEIMFVATAKDGYEFEKWDGIASDKVKVAKELDVKAKFKKKEVKPEVKKHKVTFTANEKGTFAATVKGGAAVTSGAEVEEGKEVEVTFTLKDAVKTEFKGFAATGATITADAKMPNKGTFTMGKADVVVTANVEDKEEAKVLTISSMKVAGVAVTFKDGKGSVTVPSDKAKVTKELVTEVKAKTQHKTPKDVTVEAKDITLTKDEDLKPGKAVKVEVVIAAKAGEYLETKVEVEVTRDVSVPVLKSLKILGKDVKIKDGKLESEDAVKVDFKKLTDKKLTKADVEAKFTWDGKTTATKIADVTIDGEVAVGEDSEITLKVAEKAKEYKAWELKVKVHMELDKYTLTSLKIAGKVVTVTNGEIAENTVITLPSTITKLVSKAAATPKAEEGVVEAMFTTGADSTAKAKEVKIDPATGAVVAAGTDFEFSLAADEENKVAEWKLNKKIKVKNSELLATFLIDKGTLDADTDIGAAKLEVKNGDAWDDVTKAGTNKANEKYFAPETEVTVRITVGDDKKATSGFDKFECKKADGTTAFTTAIAFTEATSGNTDLMKVFTFKMPAESCKVKAVMKKLVAPDAGTITINGKTPFALADGATENVCDLEKIDANNFAKITQVVIKQGAATLATFAAADIEAKPASGDGDAAKLVQIDFDACTNLATAQNLVIKIKAKPGCWLEKTFTIKVKQA